MLITYICPADEPGALLTRYGKPVRSIQTAKARLARLDAERHLQLGEVRVRLPNGAERLVAVFKDGRTTTVWDVVPTLMH